MIEKINQTETVQQVSLPIRESIRGTFIKRINRFSAEVAVGGQVASAFVPNSGRLAELLVPDKPVLLAPKPADVKRKTQFDLALVWHNSAWVSIDARVPNILLGRAFKLGVFKDFSNYIEVCPEAGWGNSRFDFCLLGAAGNCWVEVKSVTLVSDEVAMFPDAPTARGKKHLAELIKITRSGTRAAVFFIVQRKDARFFTPNDQTDPEFGMLLRRARDAGVEIYVYNCQVEHNSISLYENLSLLF